MGQSPVAVKNGLGEAGGAGGEIDGSIVLFIQRHRGAGGGAVAHEADAVLGVGRAVLAHIEQGLHSGDKLEAFLKFFISFLFY